MEKQLPEGLAKYAETPIFTTETVPDKLTSEHNTKAGVWGKLIVLEGMLDYVVPSIPEDTRRIAKGETGIIEPTIIHYVRLTPDTAFQVEFYKAS